nr:DUF3422 domain-containing protein [Bradyrhizobium stylosanthis]
MPLAVMRMLLTREASMGNELDLASCKLHPERKAVLGEVHAWPFASLVSSFGMVRFVFLAKGDDAANDRGRFIEFCR